MFTERSAIKIIPTHPAPTPMRTSTAAVLTTDPDNSPQYVTGIASPHPLHQTQSKSQPCHSPPLILPTILNTHNDGNNHASCLSATGMPEVL